MKAFAFLIALLCAGPSAAQTISGCSSVASNRVATSKDVVKLQADADCFDRARAMADDASQVRRKRAAVLAKPVESAPKPPETPAPSLAGLAKIASNFAAPPLLQPSWGTGAVATKSDDGEGAFRFICYPSHLSYDDPVIFPGQPGKSHLHDFFGNTKADAHSTYSSLRATGDSTCDNPLNRSAYWIPAMMNGAGKVVRPDYVSIYYKGLPPTSPLCAQLGKACVRIPRGLRYVFGYNMQNPAASAPPESMWWNCDAPNAGGHFPSLTAALVKCPTGARVGMVLTGPGCWNGKDLDSTDHRSHMAFSYYDNGKGRCPATHPYVIPHFTIGSWYTTDATAKAWYLASDRMAGMPDAIPGTTQHADWFGAWDDDTMETWHTNCIDKLLSCAGGDLGNGKQMRRNDLSREPAVRVVDAPVRPTS